MKVESFVYYCNQHGNFAAQVLYFNEKVFLGSVSGSEKSSKARKVLAKLFVVSFLKFMIVYEVSLLNYFF
jgi:hypothetical protein